MARTDTRIKVQGGREVRNALRRYGLRTTQRIGVQTRRTAVRIESQAKRNIRNQGAVNTGRTRASIGFKKDQFGLSAQVFAKAKSANPVEFGRAPGKFPPVRPIRNWVREKLQIKNRKRINQVAYLVGRAIARRGIKPRPFFFPAVDQERPVHLSAIKKIIKTSRF